MFRWTKSIKSTQTEKSINYKNKTKINKKKISHKKRGCGSELLLGFRPDLQNDFFLHNKTFRQKKIIHKSALFLTIPNLRQSRISEKKEMY